MVYLWDRVSNPDAIAKATSRYWKHDKAAFSLYKSAEKHGKFGQRMPVAVWACLQGSRRWPSWAPCSESGDRAIRTSGTGQGRSCERRRQCASRISNDSSRSSTRDTITALALVRGNTDQAGPRAAGRQGDSDGGRLHDQRTAALHLQDRHRGERVARLTGEQLAAMGYYYTEHGSCVGVLRYGDRERLITCAKPAQVSLTQQPSSEPPKTVALPPT